MLPERLLNMVIKSIYFLIPVERGLQTSSLCGGISTSISGKTIVESQLLSSIGQANRALLNMTADYNPSLLARSIKKYFERNDEALEVLIFKGKKSISVSRDLTLSPDYYRIFMRRYVK